MTAQELLKKYGQAHLLRCVEQLSDGEKEAFLSAIKEIDFQVVDNMFKKFLESKEVADKLDSVVTPVPKENSASTSTCTPEERQQWIDAGLQEVSENNVAVVLMAGGQGTRLGSSSPKGMFNVELPSGKSLYQLKAERILKLQKLAAEHSRKPNKGGCINWYIMTSEATMAQTKEYFETNNYFGLESENVKFFEQYTLPCMDFKGKIILANKDKIAQSPDGNGGLYKALVQRGMLDHMKKAGIKHIHVIGVDNILTKIADPAFIGLCKLRSVDCGAKVIKKSSPAEKVGVVCKVRDIFQVVEYSEVSEKTSTALDECGQLKFNSGNICNHYFSLDFLQNVCGKELPLHIAKKKIPYLGDDCQVVKPTEVNGIKMEKFVFDVFKHSNKLQVPRGKTSFRH